MIRVWTNKHRRIAQPFCPLLLLALLAAYRQSNWSNNDKTLFATSLARVVVKFESLQLIHPGKMGRMNNVKYFTDRSQLG